MKKNESKSLVIAKVNNQKIVIVQNGTQEKFVPVRPICDALGIDTQTQIDKIKQHPLWSSSARLSLGDDITGNSRPMFMISLEYVFGWIMSIHPANVKPESYDTVLKYQDECNHVLFNHFILKARFLEEQNAELLKLDDEEQSERRNFQTTKDRLTDIRMRKAELRNRTFETWEMEQRQLSIPFETAEIVEPNQEEE